MIEEKVYQTTKEDCQKSIKGVCPGCGSLVEPIETHDNSDNPTFWAGCKNCHEFCSGVNPLIFKIARHMVTKEGLVPYHHLKEYDGDKEMEDYCLRRQISGACSIVTRVLLTHFTLSATKQEID
jgi:hypothetical protein